MIGGRVRFQSTTKVGRWKDFASGDGGSDFISLVAYLRRFGQGEAARELADKLGVPPYKPNGVAASKPIGLNGRQNGAPPLAAPKAISWVQYDPPPQPQEYQR